MKSLPNSGRMPRSGKNPEVASIACRRSAWPCPVKVKLAGFRAAVEWKRSVLLLKSRNCRTETVVRGRFNVGNWSCRTTTRFGSWIGSGRTRTALTTLKMAAFAPMPTARVSSTVVVKAGLFLSTRNAYRTSLQICRTLASSLTNED